jgi:hypothetical protein
MPNILKRPMFRKGGSTSYGTGITANLEPRTNYEGGGGTGYEDIINRQYQSMLPSDEQLLKNLITGFGASAPQDPNQLQTWGTAFSSAGRTAAALRAKQEAPAMEYKKQAGIQAIKNLTAPEKDELMRRAQQLAQIRNIPLQKAQEIVFKRWLEGTPSKAITKQTIFMDQYATIKKDQKWLPEDEKINIARTLTEVIQGNAPNAAIAPYSINNLDKKKLTEFTIGKNYINPADGFIYNLQNDGKFKKIWPSN